ncbi:MAG: hypothetical protein AAB433_06675 [Nitrospirota bacterium]
MDFSTASFDELDQHAMEQLVFGTGELSPILKGHLFIERVLETLISENISKPAALFGKRRLNFELKVDLALALGLLSEKHVSAFKALNKIRNSYTHQASYKVTFEELTSLKFDWEPIQQKAYKAACTKGVEEAAQIGTIFLCWKAIYLLKKPTG